MAQKVKVIHWKREYNKVLQPLDKKMSEIFRDFEKESKNKGLRSTPELNKMWREKYAARADRLTKRLDALCDKLWLKYHVSTSSTKAKPGYKIVE